MKRIRVEPLKLTPELATEGFTLCRTCSGVTHQDDLRSGECENCAPALCDACGKREATTEERVTWNYSRPLCDECRGHHLYIADCLSH